MESKFMETNLITKIDKALKAIDFQLPDDERDDFYSFVYEKHLKLYTYDIKYPKYYKWLLFSIWDKI